MSQATAATLEEKWPLSDSPHKDPNTWLSSLLEDSQAPSARQSRGKYVYSAVNIERLSSFVNQYPRAWHMIRQMLGPDEAFRLTQLRRNKAITSLRVKHRWSLQAIGDLFDLSRERVRQLTPSIDGQGVTPDLHDDRPRTPREVRRELKEAFRKVVRTPQAWNGRGQVSKPWVIDYLGYEPELPDLDFRRLSDSKAEFILRYGMGLGTREEMRAWFEEMYFERSMTYAEIARWLSQRFVSVAPMTVHRTATSVLGVEGYGRGKRTDR